MLLRLLVLVMAGVHLSQQDMVTSVPDEPTDGTTDYISTSTTQKPNLKPKIRSLHVYSDIKYRYATTVVTTRVINPDAKAREAVFAITLPESAFISNFLMEIKDKVYQAYVKEKEEAKAVYDQAVSAGQFAGHVALDARDSNSFTVSVNVEAHGKVTFNLTYEQLLSRELGVYKNVININPNQIVEDMSVKVDIEEPTEITHLEVPEIQESNNIADEVKENKIAKIEVLSPNHKKVSWAPTSAEQKILRATGVKGQFVVKYDVKRESNPQQILVNEGYFVHFFAPEDLPKMKKHAVFVLDYSGSMYGQKLQQLKDAMKKILSDLEPTDYYSIVIFHSIVMAWSPSKIFTEPLVNPSPWQIEESHSSNFTLNDEFVVEATEANINASLSYLNSYQDLGSTNIMGGLRLGLKLVDIGLQQLRERPHQPIIIFLTDGQPNEEVYDTDEIVSRTKNLNTKENPIFSLAFGYGADFNFLRKLSLSNHGFARNIYEAADASAQLNNFYHTVASPLLSNVTFAYLPGQVDNSSSTKHDFPIFFLGSEIVVAGKLDKEAEKSNTTLGELTGVSANGIRKYPIVIEKISYQKPHSVGHLEKTWAYLTIHQLLDKAASLDAGKEKNDTRAKALQLALQYSFVTPLTSLVVVKPNETESSVGTEALKPGMEGSGMYLTTPFSAMPLASPVGYSGYAGGLSASPAYLYMAMPQHPMPASYSAMPASYSAMPASYPASQTKFMYNSGGGGGGLIPDYTDIRLSEDSIDFDTAPAPELKKITLNQLSWLPPDNTTVIVNGTEYTVGLNQTDTVFGNCTVENESGDCRHIEFCALNVFKDSMDIVVQYLCAIPGIYLGVCCPRSIL